MALGSTQPLTGVFPGGKGGRCVRLTTLPPSCAVVTKSGNLIFLEPSGPVQACNGTDLHFTLIVKLILCRRTYVCFKVSLRFIQCERMLLHSCIQQILTSPKYCKVYFNIVEPMSGFTLGKEICFLPSSQTDNEVQPTVYQILVFRRYALRT